MSASAAPAPIRSAFYRPELDALRFFAFFAVFVHHTLPHDPTKYTAQHLPGFLAVVAGAGAFGVDLFFLLSAYLITSLLLRERRQTGKIAVRAFYLRRILRIWPLYFFALLVAVVWGFFSPKVQVPVSYLAAYLLLAGNWMIVFAGPPVSFISVLWSVSVEEQFYLVWPLLVNKFPVRKVAIALIAIAWATRLWLAAPGSHFVWTNTLARLDTIAIGVLLAGLRTNFSRAKRRLLFAAGMLAWLVAGYFAGPSPWFREAPPWFVVFGYPLVTLGSTLLFLCVLGADLKGRPLVYLGKISYGLYVYHTLAITLVLGWFKHTGVLPISAALALTILLAAISYQVLEKPALRLKERYTYVQSRPV